LVSYSSSSFFLFVSTLAVWSPAPLTALGSVHRDGEVAKRTQPIVSSLDSSVHIKGRLFALRSDTPKIAGCAPVFGLWEQGGPAASFPMFLQGARRELLV